MALQTVDRNAILNLRDTFNNLSKRGRLSVCHISNENAWIHDFLCKRFSTFLSFFGLTHLHFKSPVVHSSNFCSGSERLKSNGWQKLPTRYCAFRQLQDQGLEKFQISWFFTSICFIFLWIKPYLQLSFQFKKTLNFWKHCVSMEVNCLLYFT